MASTEVDKSQISCRKICHGPTSIIILDIVPVYGSYKHDPICLEYKETINVNKLVDMLVKFHVFFTEDNTSMKKVQASIRMKKSEGVKDCTVPITIECGTFKEQIFCSTEWVEVKSNPMSHSSPDAFEHINVYIFRVEIKATVHVVMPTASLPNPELYEDTELTDMRLRTADGKVDMHKAVLFLHSDSAEWKESTEVHISMDGISVKTLQQLKDYMYLGTLPDEGLEPLLRVAVHYKIYKLVKDCSIKIIETVKPKDIDGLIALACEFNVPELVRSLVFRIPDKVINGMFNLNINVEEVESNGDDDDEDNDDNV